MHIYVLCVGVHEHKTKALSGENSFPGAEQLSSFPVYLA